MTYAETKGFYAFVPMATNAVCSQTIGKFDFEVSKPNFKNFQVITRDLSRCWISRMIVIMTIIIITIHDYYNDS